MARSGIRGRRGEAGIWQHVALTYDKSLGAGKLQVNGALVTEANLGSFMPQTRFLIFGHRAAVAGQLRFCRSR